MRKPDLYEPIGDFYLAEDSGQHRLLVVERPVLEALFAIGEASLAILSMTDAMTAQEHLEKIADAHSQYTKALAKKSQHG